MLEPYRMIVVNLFTSLSLGIFLFVYTNKLKKKIHPLLLITLIGILPLISIARKGTYESGDLSINVVKLIAYVQSFLNGNIPPIWAADLNASYGYPLFLFTYPLPYFLAFIIKMIGFSYVGSIKLLLAITYLVSGYFMYLFLNDFLRKKSALVGTIFYLFAPYHLIDMHFRVTIGEMTSFVFLPLILFGINKLSTNIKMFYFVLTSFSISLLLFSHQAISLAFIPFSITYVFFLKLINKRMRLTNFIYILFSYLVGFLLSAFYFIPVLIEKSLHIKHSMLK